MGIIGCGLVLAGLLGDALLGAGAVAALVGSVGAAMILCELLHQHKLQRQAESWRAAYPPYKY